MKTRIFLTTLIAVAIVGAIFGYRIHKDKKAKEAMAAMKRPPATVTTAQAIAETWRNTLSAVGTVESFQGITLRSELEGRIVKLAFDSGRVVKEGDLLLELDASTEEAQLKSAEAAAKLAAASLTRAKELRANNTNSAAELDSAEAQYAQALAAVENIKTVLAKKRVVAPFAGRLGIRHINIGQFLNKGDAIVALEAINPAYVDFALPQQELPKLAAGLPVRVNIDAFPEQTFEGKIEAIDPRVTDTTRNVRIRAIVPNADEKLRPGFFARVTVDLPNVTEVLQLPSTAVVYSPYGNSVYVVNEKKGEDGKSQLVVEQRPVTTGGRRGDQVSILKGLKAGDQVVSAGQMKLRNGAAVRIDNKVTPANQAQPKPSES